MCRRRACGRSPRQEVPGLEAERLRQVRDAACQAHGCGGGVRSVVLAKTSRVGCDVIACQRLALVGRPRRVGGWQASRGRPLPDLVEVQRVWGLARAHVCSAPSGLAGRRVPAGGSGPAPQSTRTASALMGKRGTQTWQETSRLCWSPPRATDRRPPRSPPQRHPEASALQKPHHTQCLQPGRESHPHPALEDATAEGEGRQGGPPPCGVWPPRPASRLHRS